MGFKFCANLNFLFTENNTTMLERFRLAHRAGFKGVENGIPRDFNEADAVAVQKETGLEVVLLNIVTGSIPGGEFGCIAMPDRENEFKQNLATTVRFAKALNCKIIHLMAGKLTVPHTQEIHDFYEKNLKHAANVLAAENIVGVIEPICTYGVPGYYLNNYDRAIQILQNINSPNLKLMVDLYHLQHIRGNITHSFKELMPLIGHVQIAQVPGRNEPNTQGELNYSYIFKALADAGYNGWIGCEYKPISGSFEGLKWIKEYGYEL